MAHYYNQLQNQPLVSWEQAHHGWVPHGKAVVGGYDINGETIYVGRALCCGEIIPGKIVPSHHTCYVPWGHQEHSIKDYQVLTMSGDVQVAWVPGSNGEIPTGAIEGGRTGNGEKLYIGRAHHHGSHVVGKVHPSHRLLYIPFGGKEESLANYEVLCVKSVAF